MGELLQQLCLSKIACYYNFKEPIFYQPITTKSLLRSFMYKKFSITIYINNIF